MEVVKLLLAHPGVDINKADNEVRGRGGAGRERVQGGQRSWVHTRGCGGGRLTSHALTMLAWGALLGGYVQGGNTPLHRACYCNRGPQGGGEAVAGAPGRGHQQDGLGTGEGRGW
jgi:hypothetical protein